ncbi:MAG: bifunctional adenosylcobinamide kinase/adenosylcobinamide-phosphate guanylyltransferase [Desulfovibrio sp.]|uniref:bifunctional adenosylcobinamide kinase/adenosylcobinamide-phosphate guanylyltransferase n=1 Tax=Desulfovibrio sp. 7SRBS1 TaxID=3378064 RepID=UPI003B401B9F
MIIFITGGQASGKSDFALDILYRNGGKQLFIATGRAEDESFRRQIRLHRDARPAEIPVIETGTDLADSLRRALSMGTDILLDSLDFWYFLAMQENQLNKRTTDLLAALDEVGDKNLIIVSSETGLGPVAADSTTRAFTRGLGRLNAKIAAKADSSWLVVAGRGIQLEGAVEGPDVRDRKGNS